MKQSLGPEGWICVTGCMLLPEKMRSVTRNQHLSSARFYHLLLAEEVGAGWKAQSLKKAGANVTGSPILCVQKLSEVSNAAKKSMPSGRYRSDIHSASRLPLRLRLAPLLWRKSWSVAPQPFSPETVMDKPRSPRNCSKSKFQ